MNKEDLRNTSVGRWLQGEDSTPLVVRCKNCKRRGKVMICPMWDQKVSDYDYCSYGEKKG